MFLPRMKILLMLFAFVACTVKLRAQQNLFNIPSGDVTPKKKFFYQHQLNFYDVNQFETKSHLVYGVGKNWDIGINFLDLPLQIGNDQFLSYNDSSNRKPLYPILMFTAQKQWTLNHSMQINAGAQMGSNVSSRVENKEFAFLTYALFKWKPGKRGYLLAGPYLANDIFVGGPPEFRPGYMIGYEFKINDRWLLMGDFISGSHKKSQTVLGGGFNLSDRIQIFFGALLAYPNTKLQDGLVIEFNWYGWNYKGH